MSGLAVVGLVGYAVVVAFWMALHVGLLFYRSGQYFLRPGGPQLADEAGPRVSILLAAKDEEGNIGTCVRSVLQSEYRNFELIVLDDRSSDRTAAEAAEAAGGDDRVRVLRIEELPPGWTGKMNAVRQGLAIADGEVLLLIDADSRHTPQTLAAALAVFQERDLHLLSLMPGHDNPGLLFRLLQPLIVVLLFFFKPLPMVNSRKRKSMAFCWGGFLMMRRRSLEAVGGLEAIQGRIAADIALFHRFKQCDQRVRLLHAPELVSTYMYQSVAAMIAGWTRILRVTVESRVGLLLAALAGVVLLSLSAYGAVGLGLVELFAGTGRPFPVLVGVLGLGHLVLHLSLLGRIYRLADIHPLHALGHLPAAVFLCYLLVVTMIRCRQRQMLWRGTGYQLNAGGQPCSI